MPELSINYTTTTTLGEIEFIYIYTRENTGRN
jgi:hypothetical protein